MKVSLLHPSRSRPGHAYETASKWITRAGVNVEYILSLDIDDPKFNEYQPSVNIIRNQNRSAVDAINNAAYKSTGDILIVVSDDTDCPENWAVSLLKEVEGKTDWILKTQDGLQPWIITMPVMDRAYYNRFGYIYYPEYLHMFCDTELTCVADMTGRKLESKLLFKHEHDSIKDDLKKRSDATWSQGESLFIERAKKNFGLINPPCKVTNQEYINWMRSKGIR